MANFEVFQGKDDQFYFRFKASNGESVLRSEGYVSRSNAHRGVEAVKALSPKDSSYDRKPSKDNQYYFTMVAGNGEIVAVSETYTSTSGREKGVECVKREARGAGVVDL